MRMRKQKGIILNCFSPPVMFATMAIETVLAIYTLVRYKMNTIGRLSVATLIALATFQLAEYFVCTGSSSQAVPWHSAFNAHQCTGNYVIFHLAPNSGGLYYAYYYGWLATAISLGVIWGKALIRKGKAAQTRLEAVQGLIAGYLVFLIPTTVVNTLKPSTISGLPSVMCGFAVLFALILGFYILPRAADS
jgi:hypothetical protein